MKFSVHPILLILFVLATLAMAMPTPQPSELAFQPEVRDYHYDKLGARIVEDDRILVPRHVRVPGFIKKIFKAVKHVVGL
jgi:hypothetical protein